MMFSESKKFIFISTFCLILLFMCSCRQGSETLSGDGGSQLTGTSDLSSALGEISEAPESGVQDNSAATDVSEPWNGSETVECTGDLSGVSVPEESKSEVSKPVVSIPEESKSETSRPAVSEPEESKSEVSKPDVSEPEESKSESSRPAVSVPEESKPETSRPDVSEPEISEPEFDDTDAIYTGTAVATPGMKVEELTAAFGQPDDICDGTTAPVWYVYTNGDYKDFFMAGVLNGQVVAVYAQNTKFSCNSVGFGDTCPIAQDNNSYVKGIRSTFDRSKDLITTYFVDGNAGSKVYAVMLSTPASALSYSYGGFHDREISEYGEAQLSGSCTLIFHLINAFRVCYGLEPCDRSTLADTSSRLHSEDMAENNYVSHDSLDGTTMSERMTAVGISWRRCGENIAAGTDDAILSHNGWVNSAGHRETLLRDYECVGVGAAFNENSDYRVYWTQNFYTPL